jgi:hypothetical protein
MQFISQFGDARMKFEEITELRKECEALKENDGKSGIIDFDIFMQKMLSIYRVLVTRAKTYVINAFAASDLDGNGVCNL